MSNKQKAFYKAMYVLSLIGIVLNFVAILILFYSWFINTKNQAISYKVNLGIISFDTTKIDRKRFYF